MLVGTDVLHSFCGRSQKETSDPAVPESAQKGDTHSLHWSFKTKDLRDGRPGRLFCVISPDLTIHTVDPRRPLGKAQRQDR